PPPSEPPPEAPVEPPPVEPPLEPPKPEEPKPERPEEKKSDETKLPELKPDSPERDPEAEKRAQMEEMWKKHKSSKGADKEGPPEPVADPNRPDHEKILDMILKDDNEVKKRGDDSLEWAEGKHGSPETWKFVKEKDGSGGPATAEHYDPGQTK